jgi:hypothetical protein
MKEQERDLVERGFGLKDLALPVIRFCCSPISPPHCGSNSELKKYKRRGAWTKNALLLSAQQHLLSLSLSLAKY